MLLFGLTNERPGYTPRCLQNCNYYCLRLLMSGIISSVLGSCSTSQPGARRGNAAGSPDLRPAQTCAVSIEELARRAQDMALRRACHAGRAASPAGRPAAAPATYLCLGLTPACSEGVKSHTVFKRKREKKERLALLLLPAVRASVVAAAGVPSPGERRCRSPAALPARTLKIARGSARAAARRSRLLTDPRPARRRPSP